MQMDTHILLLDHTQYDNKGNITSKVKILNEWLDDIAMEILVAKQINSDSVGIEVAGLWTQTFGKETFDKYKGESKENGMI